ncbi:hypothetical protein [Chryseobacterium oryctis]|uniref:Uncharacterized protein n=1 Tax=Chryseobacterium oryctis TaxID=2952618 RepID=A0ABT3HPC2_9FLAO|nr:hypothetical protein [Chryseobacterium oryctis]MCW3161641.1 hypothetical protein [Chryseobacterium oryctis]
MGKLQNYSFSNISLYNLAKFVVEENFIHHNCDSFENLTNDVISVYKEESLLNGSIVFFSKSTTSNDITGSIRVLNWNRVDVLPIQKIFNIDPNQIIPDPNVNIWHIGRFAVKKNADKSGFKTFKTLMASAINEVCKKKNSVVLAECDAKLLKTLNLLGIESIVLADSIEYLGSETIPVLLTYKGLYAFLEKNRNLLHKGNKNSFYREIILQQIA